MANAASADHAACARERVRVGVLVMALTALAAALLTCWSGPVEHQQQGVSLSPTNSATSALHVADWRLDSDAENATGVGAAGALDHCAPCPTERNGLRCSPHMPDGNLNSASPAAPSVEAESGSDPAPRALDAGYEASGPPARGPDLHFLQLLRV